MLRPLCSGPAICNADLQLVIVKESFEVWLLNRGKSAVQLGPAELFGFGTGSFQDRAPGAVSEVGLRSCSRCCPAVQQRDPLARGEGYLTHVLQRQRREEDQVCGANRRPCDAAHGRDGSQRARPRHVTAGHAGPPFNKSRLFKRMAAQ